MKRQGIQGPKVTARDQGKKIELAGVDDYALITDVTGDTVCVPQRALLRFADALRADQCAPKS